MVYYSSKTLDYTTVKKSAQNNSSPTDCNTSIPTCTTYLWERCSRARIFTGTAFPCVPAPLHPCWWVSEHPAPPGIDIERVDKMTILGVLVNNSLTATDHVSTVLASCASLMYIMHYVYCAVTVCQSNR